MGQYHHVVNHSKREYLHPHKFGDGLKLLEFGSSGCGTMCALAILLAEDNDRDGQNGGDLHAPKAEHPIVGSWAGDQIAIVGDYGEPVRVSRGGHAVPDAPNAYTLAEAEYREVSSDVLRAMACDSFVKKQLADSSVDIPEPELPDPESAFTL